MKTRILLPILYILLGSSLAIGQDERQDVLLLKENKVKSYIVDKDFVYEYTYSDSTIIEYISEFGDQFENKYYLNEQNQLDSVLYGSYYDDSLHTSKAYYYYNAKNQLINKIHPPSSPGSSSSKRSFVYNESGTLDSVYIVTDLGDNLYGPRTDSPVIYSSLSFEYDNKGRLVLKKSTQPYGFKEIQYQYDGKDRIKSELWIFGYNQDGINNPEDRIVFEMINFYHPSGYREKQIETEYTIKPDGTKIIDTVQNSYYHKNGLLEKVEREHLTTPSMEKEYNFKYEYKFYEK